MVLYGLAVNFMVFHSFIVLYRKARFDMKFEFFLLL